MEEYVVADETGSIIETLCEGDIEKVEVGKSYNFNYLTLRLWNQTKSLTATPDSQMMECEDIDCVEQTLDCKATKTNN